MYECSFELNNKAMSMFKVGATSFPAFSGRGDHVNRRISACHIGFGPIPPGLYYILDRKPGGLLDSFRQLYNDKSEWFALYANDGKIDDETYCNRVRRGEFRLHPKGLLGRSEGCVTIENRADFQRLGAMLRGSSTVVIPGASLKAYGRVIVK
jgi:hypothetical protein